MSASRMPTDEALGRYYGAYYDDAQYRKRGEKVTIGDSRHMGRSLASWMKCRAVDRRLRVLDFGGGDGTVAALAVEELLRQSVIESAEILVVDYNDKIEPRADSRIKMGHAKTLDAVVDDDFDVVLASAVMEHIPAGRSTMDQLLRRVRPGGVFYARTPQVASFFRVCRPLGIRLDFTFPGHVHDLGQRFWEGCFQAPDLAPDFNIVLSKPSLVESRLMEAPIRAIVARLFKAPWYLLGRHWSFVGGWEIVVERRIKS